MTCGAWSSPSGLWHQVHARGQPFRKTVVRIPGPSWIVNSRMSNTIPVVTIARSEGPRPWAVPVWRSPTWRPTTASWSSDRVAGDGVRQHLGQDGLLRCFPAGEVAGDRPETHHVDAVAHRDDLGKVRRDHEDRSATLGDRGHELI